MNKQIEQIKEFQTIFGLGLHKEPVVPDTNTILLRNSLIKEEVEELFQASITGDIIECADAIGDILYVLLGTACEYGLIDKVEDIFDLIHSNNIKKIDPVTGTVLRREDGKIIKPEGFKKVELSTLFEK